MAVAVDGSTPVRWTGAPNAGVDITSASFTAPTDALLVMCVNSDGATSTHGTMTYAVADSGGLTWTNRVTRTIAETTDGGGSAIYTARTTSNVARTATFRQNNTNAVATRISAKLYVLTGVDVNGTPVDTVTASNEGGSAADPTTTTSITPGANGLLIVVDTDWSQTGAITSSDLTVESGDYAGAITASSGYKTCTSGVGVTGNLNPPATPQFKWCQVTVREVAGAAQDTPELYGRPAGRRGAGQMQQVMSF